MTLRAYKRSVGVRFGAASPVTPIDFVTSGGLDPFSGLARSFSNLDDNGIRIEFDFVRTLATDPDRGSIKLWNLSQKSHDAILADLAIRQAQRKTALRIKLPQPARSNALLLINELHKVSVFAGYRGKPDAIFTGDYIRISTRERVGFTDFLTTIELGDSWLGAKDGFIDNPAGPGISLPALIDQFAQISGATVGPDAAAKIAVITPDAKITAWTGGALGQLPAREAFDNLGGLLKRNFFIRDGILYVLGAGQVIADFALAVLEGRDLLDFTKGVNDAEYTIRTNLDGRIQPGRAIFMFDEFKKPFPGNPFRVEATRMRGDTHGGDFYTEADLTKFLGPELPKFDLSVLA